MDEVAKELGIEREKQKWLTKSYSARTHVSN
jgi:hypothetical protein